MNWPTALVIVTALLVGGLIVIAAIARRDRDGNRK